LVEGCEKGIDASGLGHCTIHADGLNCMCAILGGQHRVDHGCFLSSMPSNTCIQRAFAFEDESWEWMFCGPAGRWSLFALHCFCNVVLPSLAPCTLYIAAGMQSFSASSRHRESVPFSTVVSWAGQTHSLPATALCSNEVCCGEHAIDQAAPVSQLCLCCDSAVPW
jgi:hypothetical protein